jgi:hypothetical protein
MRLRKLREDLLEGFPFRLPYLEDPLFSMRRMSTPRILAFGGSLRRDSLNQKLAAIAAEEARERVPSSW